MKRSGVWALVLPLLVVLACSDSDPVDPEPLCETMEGLVVLETQAEVDAAAGVCVIAGGLAIAEAAETDDPITTLAPLSDLRSVGTPDGGSLRIQWTTELETLEGLEGVSLAEGADIWIEGNAALTSLAALGSETEGAVRRLTDVRISSNGALESLAGLSNLLAPTGVEVTGLLGVWNNASLASLDGLGPIDAWVGLLSIESNPSLGSLAALADIAAIGSLHLADLPFTTLTLELVDVRDVLRIERNPALVSLTVDAREVGRQLSVSENWWLETLDIALVRAPDYLAVAHSRELTTFDLALAEGGLGGFSLMSAPLLTALGFDGVLIQTQLALYDTGLTTLDAFTTIPSLPGRFILGGNEQLVDIEAFSGLESVEGIQVQDNAALCVPAWLDDVTVTGPVPRAISGNACD